jgi:hypothetical protein
MKKVWRSRSKEGKTSCGVRMIGMEFVLLWESAQNAGALHLTSLFLVSSSSLPHLLAMIARTSTSKTSSTSTSNLNHQRASITTLSILYLYGMAIMIKLCYRYRFERDGWIWPRHPHVSHGSPAGTLIESYDFTLALIFKYHRSYENPFPPTLYEASHRTKALKLPTCNRSCLALHPHPNSTSTPSQYSQCTVTYY